MHRWIACPKKVAIAKTPIAKSKGLTMDLSDMLKMKFPALKMISSIRIRWRYLYGVRKLFFFCESRYMNDVTSIRVVCARIIILVLAKNELS